MGLIEKTFQTTAIIDAQHKLILDEPLPIAEKTRVKVIVLLPNDFDIIEKEWLKAANANPAFDFLKDAEEDIYTHADGRPFSDQG